MLNSQVPLQRGKVRNVTLSKDLKKIFLNDFHKNHHAKFVPFAGYHMPINYKEGIIKEHLQVRNSGGLFDVSHMGQILIPINKNNSYSLSKFIPLNIEKMIFNKCFYSFLLNESGGIIDDLIISKIQYQSNDFFYIIYNASRKNIDENIFFENLTNFTILKNNSLIAIQGPKTKKILNFIEDFSDLFFMRVKTTDYLDNEIIVSRTGYTGEDGFEISIPNKIVINFVETLLSNSKIKLCGLGSRDSLRIEAGLSLYGNELTEKITPIEANLTWSIHQSRLEDKELNGSKILIEQINSGVQNTKVGFKSKSKVMIRANTKIFDAERNQIGYISSGTFSPILNSSIGIGYINKSKINEKIYILIRGKWDELNIVSLPFIQKNYKRRDR